MVIDRKSLMDVYSVSNIVVFNALSALYAEGYLSFVGRDFYVRSWTKDSIEDSYDIWANVIAVGCGRTAERASTHSLELFTQRFSHLDLTDFSDPYVVEQFVQDYVAFNYLVIQLSNANSIVSATPKLISNFLVRKSIWCSSPDEILSDIADLKAIVKAISKRDSAYAAKRSRDLILRPEAGVLASLNADMPRAMNAAITRFTIDSAALGVAFGLGEREPSLNGKIFPYGLPLN
jgi:DNA-binding GntR family transcriptional regulator